MVLDGRWFEVFVGRVGRVVIFAGVRIVVRVVQDDVWWQTFDNPFVLKTFIGGQSLFWIPFETATDEIDE